MSGDEGRWERHPTASGAEEHLPTVEPGRVVGLGAICSLGPLTHGDQSFEVGEFVALEDGRRVMLHRDRGFTIGLRSSGRTTPAELREHETIESLTEIVLQVVLPDDDEPAEDHPWRELADLARARGLHVTAAQLRHLRYEVVLTDDVRRVAGGSGLPP